jgi:DNA repair photolyase
MRQQTALFSELTDTRSCLLPVLAEQKDITYYGITARSVLNGPDTTGMGYWSINPYVGCAFGCAYCYARYAHRYVMERQVKQGTGNSEQGIKSALPISSSLFPTSLPSWLAFERRILVKQNAADVLRKALRSGSEKHLGLIRGEAIVIGTATDPYQPAERRFRVTRAVLEVLAEHPGLRIVIITKSPLVTRDIDLLTRIARRSKLSIHISLITLRRDLARRLEPRAPTPESRIRALTRLSEAGLDAGVNCMPVLPGITDSPADLEALVKRVAEAGATYVGVCALRLQAAARERYLPFIAQEFPHLAARYRAAYATSHEVSERYRVGLRSFFDRLCRKYGIRDGSREEEPAAGDEEVAGDDRGTAAGEQLALSL